MGRPRRAFVVKTYLRRRTLLRTNQCAKHLIAFRKQSLWRFKIPRRLSHRNSAWNSSLKESPLKVPGNYVMLLFKTGLTLSEATRGCLSVYHVLVSLTLRSRETDFGSIESFRNLFHTLLESSSFV